MGKGSGGVSVPPPNVVQPGRVAPGEDTMFSHFYGRAGAAAPWSLTHWRPEDMLFGLNAPMMQVPQFNPQPGTSMFSATGGYSPGMPQGSPMAFGLNPWMTGMLPGMMGMGGMFPPALNYAGGTQYAGPFQPAPQQQNQQNQGGTA